MAINDINHELSDDYEAQYINRRRYYLPWEDESSAKYIENEKVKSVLQKHAGATYFGPRSFVSPEAHIYTNKFKLGAGSWVAGGALVRGDVAIGDESTINSFAHIAGRVRIGKFVRIGGMAAIFGFNHGHSDPNTPIYRQAHTSIGITIEDDVWIGAASSVLDGVSIGAHSIVAAGAVVTKSFPAYAVIAGNPARLIRSRM